MNIGIISDTHNKLSNTKEAVKQLLNKQIAYLIHAGDIGEDVLNYLDSLEIPTIAVYGNTDRSLQPPKRVILQKPPYYFKIGSTTFKLMHEPYYLTPDSDIIIYGHLHKFECQRAKSLYINPGEVCAREKPIIECALLDLDTMVVTYLYKEHKWNSKKVCK